MDFSKAVWRKLPTDRKTYSAQFATPHETGRDVFEFRIEGLFKEEVVTFELSSKQVVDLMPKTDQPYNLLVSKAGIAYALKNAMLCSPLEELVSL